ncbi:hypothetical protein RF11_14274 [Thelohanellus kitauei]|uniref:Uncharacterized protein n=1 Tax=Thelohanellus kitauei TaxID=669202 RepID=A0A0C2MMS9_THEKT|nr:hypothetical protein RF11_14274 [Thelohanellus kitauei]
MDYSYIYLCIWHFRMRIRDQTFGCNVNYHKAEYTNEFSGKRLFKLKCLNKPIENSRNAAFIKDATHCEVISNSSCSKLNIYKRLIYITTGNPSPENEDQFLMTES